ncbi:MULTISPECIES: hypothetical protein [unclassified Carboxylicivirga]
MSGKRKYLMIAVSLVLLTAALSSCTSSKVAAMQCPQAYRASAHRGF